MKKKKKKCTEYCKMCSNFFSTFGFIIESHYAEID